MTNGMEISAERQDQFLPDDLSLYIGKKTLVKLILEAVEGIDLGEPEECDAFGGDGFRPAMMLTLLTYCYATGVYASGDVELNVRRDQMTRYLCANAYPDIDVIRSFRRHDRAKIKQCLAATLSRVWELRFRGEDAKPMVGLSYFRTSLSRWTDSMPVPEFDEQAEERITRAVRADSMALDN